MSVRAGIRLAPIPFSFLVVLSAMPAPAFALCPNCLGQTRALTPTLRLLGAFLLVPFVVAYVAARLIRRACRAPRA